MHFEKSLGLFTSHVAQLCWIIHTRCIRIRYSPLRDHLAQRIQPLVLKVPDTVALKWSDLVQFCAERIHIFIYFIGIFRSNHTDNRSHIMRKALQFLAPSFSISLFAVSSFAHYEKINFSFQCKPLDRLFSHWYNKCEICFPVPIITTLLALVNNTFRANIQGKHHLGKD